MIFYVLTIINERFLLRHSILIGSDAKYFDIDEDTGDMNVRVRLDADGGAGSSHLDNLTITVTDRGGYNASVHLNISITDINDNPPRFQQKVYNVNFSENSQSGKSMFYCVKNK